MRGLFLALVLLASPCFACDTIGIKNNNPGNLCAGRCEWKSAIGKDWFGRLQFSSPLDGLVGIRRTLATYRHKYHINTLERLCGRWVNVKASDAAKKSWILVLRKNLNARPGQKFNFTDPEIACKIAHGIVWAENSCDPYNESLYKEAFGY